MVRILLDAVTQSSYTTRASWRTELDSTVLETEMNLSSLSLALGKSSWDGKKALLKCQGDNSADSTAHQTTPTEQQAFHLVSQVTLR